MNMTSENIVYTEFAKKKVFEQLTLAAACSAIRYPASGEVSISECNVTWRTVKVERYCLPVTRQRDVSRDFFQLFVWVLFLTWGSFFNLEGNIFFSLTTKQQIIRVFIWN